MITRQELEEAFSETNVYYASMHYGRQPTPLECVDYYLTHRKAKVRQFYVGLFSSEETEEVRR